MRTWTVLAGILEAVGHQQEQGCPTDGPWPSAAKATERGLRVRSGLRVLGLVIYTSLWTMHKLCLGQVGAT